MWSESRRTIERNHENLITSFKVHLQQFLGESLPNYNDRPPNTP